MTKQFYKDTFGWGLIVWLIGYILGALLVLFVPISSIGWIVMPIGIFITFWVLWKKVKGDSFKYYFLLAIIWTLIAVIFDHLFIVKAFNPEGGYYNVDVYLYYIITFVFPLIVGWKKLKKK